MTTLRIFGPTLQEAETFIDAEITSVDLDGTVHLGEVDGNRTWTLPMGTVNGLRKKNHAAKHSNISHPNHAVWNRLDGVRSDVHTEPFTNTEIDLDSKVQEVFTTVMEVMVNDTP